MTIDILFVTYNSRKWIESCITSIVESDYDLSQVSLCFLDNNSSDDTLDVLARMEKEYAKHFGGFYVQHSSQNLGFGKGNNAAAKLGHGEIVFCLNVDTTVYADTLRAAAREIEQSDPKVGLWELRQFPYEHPKFYDPLTRETSWSSGACFMMKRSLFESIGGFDESIFMYGEDVDLSWRVRMEGYSLKYIPKAVVNHYCYQTAGEVKPMQYVYSLINNLLLRCKFGGRKEILWWHHSMLGIMKQHGPFPHARSLVAKAYLVALPQYIRARIWHRQNREKITKQEYRFLGYDYETIRDGAFYQNARPRGDKKVSVIVRTCGRPDVLRETLLSLKAQTYPNIEIVIAEDGPAKSKKMVEEEFRDLNIQYASTGEKKGRCYVGNLAMSMATGDYFNFLDDDDLFYADHVETLVMELERHPETSIAYTLAFATPIEVISKAPYQYSITGYFGYIKNRYNLKDLLHHNLFPIQAVMFSREVYEDLGGFNEDMDVLEDWNLWVRYATKHSYHFVEKTTSVYRVPANQEISEARQKGLNDALEYARKLHDTYRFEFLGKDLRLSA